MKKRIFIAIQYLEIGGAERSLIGLLNAIDYTRYEVDLFVYRHTGEFMNLIPKEVNLLPEIKKYAAITRPIKEIVCEGMINIAIARLFAKMQYAIYKKINKPHEDSGLFQYVADCITPFLPSLKKLGKYDIGISFLTPHNIVRDKIIANKKIAWIHTDYSTICINTRKEFPVWNSYNEIIAVSQGVKTNFIKKFPKLGDKIKVVENILSPISVRKLADKTDVSEEISCKTNELRFCSVGRFSHAKNFDNIPFICKYLKNKGLSFKWYIIGYGCDEKLIKQNINITGMQDTCIILGKKENPYPYIKKCNIYIQPSRFEGKAVTVREAQILCKPVIITQFTTSSTQLKDGIDGIIVPLDNQKAADEIFKFANDITTQNKFISYMTQNDYGNEKEIEKLF